MKRLPYLTFAFAVASVVFFLVLIFLRSPFPFYPLLSSQDALDILTPLVLIPIYWLLFKAVGGDNPTRAEEIAFMLLAAIWVLGHGMHLSANSIDNLISTLAKNGTIDITHTDIYRLTYFYDEHLSHYLWHLGLVGLATLLIYREWRRPAGITTTWGITVLSGLLYGFTYFCVFLEGQTVPLGLPFALLVALFALVRGRQKLAQRPILAFFFITCLVAVVLFAGWGLYWRGFPQFSDLNWI